jgi:hypothetical protein
VKPFAHGYPALRIRHRNVARSQDFDALLVFFGRAVVADEIDGSRRQLLEQIEVGLLGKGYVTAADGQDRDVDRSKRLQKVDLFAVFVYL